MLGKQRAFTVHTFYRHLRRAIASLWLLRRAKKAVDPGFGPKVWLAVSAVNGCRICSYLHTGSALREGVPHEEVAGVLAGEFGELDRTESAALVFAQHYADTSGYPTPEALTGFEQRVGPRSAGHVLALTKAIMVGNIYGIAWDALQQRLRRRPLAGSSLGDELGIAIGVVLLAPIALAQVLWHRLRGRLRRRPSTAP